MSDWRRRLPPELRMKLNGFILYTKFFDMRGPSQPLRLAYPEWPGQVTLVSGHRWLELVTDRNMLFYCRDGTSIMVRWRCGLRYHASYHA